MNTQKIKHLLESFYEGETNRDEELLLFNFFNSSEIPSELEFEKELFLKLYDDTTKIEVPQSLEPNLNILIDRLAKEEKKQLKPKKILFWSSIAASIAIIFSIGIYFSSDSYKGDYSTFVENQLERDNDSQFTKAEYQEAENAMLLLSTNFSKGMKQLNETNNKLEKTNKILSQIFNKDN